LTVSDTRFLGFYLVTSRGAFFQVFLQAPQAKLSFLPFPLFHYGMRPLTFIPLRLSSQRVPHCLLTSNFPLLHLLSSSRYLPFKDPVFLSRRRRLLIFVSPPPSLTLGPSSAANFKRKYSPPFSNLRALPAFPVLT